MIRQSQHRMPSTGNEELFSHRPINRYDLPFALLTEQELRSVHRTFGHPPMVALGMLLQHAHVSSTDA